MCEHMTTRNVMPKPFQAVKILQLAFSAFKSLEFKLQGLLTLTMYPFGLSPDEFLAKFIIGLIILDSSIC